MSTHKTSIPLNRAFAEFAPPPPIALGRARAAAPVSEAIIAQPEEQSREAPPQPANSPRLGWKRVAALLALIAVPAMAAPGDFGAMAGDAPLEPVASDVSAAFESALAFEKPGMSFPGSAFYYLADPPEAALVALPESDPLERGAIGADAVGSLIDAGPAARAFLAGSGANYLRAQDCLAQAIWYEAASESVAGKRAVAQVVLNRVAHPSWPASVCGVVYEGSQRSTGCQFSFTCDGSLIRRKPSALQGAAWDSAQGIAAQALNGSVYAPIGHATHYHTLWVDPYWAKTLDPVGVIGAHRFYRNRGSAGQISAFTDRYTGAEPALGQSPAAPLNTALDAALDAALNAPQPDRAKAGASPAVIAPAAILETADKTASKSDSALRPIAGSLAKPALSNAGQARKKFAKAGQWKVNPSNLGVGKKGSSKPLDDADTHGADDTRGAPDGPGAPDTP